MRRRRFSTPLAAVLVVLALTAMTALPAAAGHKPGHRVTHPHGADCAPVAAATIEVLHGPVTITLANADSDGHRVGDVRATSILTTDAAGAPLGRLDAMLTTTAIDMPAAGDEIRISTLVFTFGDEGSDQIVVGGSAIYPAQGATLAEGSVTIRPIQGGSGRFAGALGSAVSEHFPDGSWRHTLDLTSSHAAVPFAAAAMSNVAFLHPLDEPKRSYRVRVGPGRADLHSDPWRGLLRALWARLGDIDTNDVERGTVRRLDGAELRRVHRARLHHMKHLPRRFAMACVAPASVRVEPPAYEGLRGAPIDEPGITRNDLGRTLPASAPGEELGLWHYTIPVGAELPPHTHAGPQIARVIRGELSYTVIAGDGTIIASDGSSTPVGPGTYVLRAGDSVVEDPDLEHYGSNRGPEVVELIAATLYPEGAPLSLPVETAPAASGAPAASPVAAASPSP